MRKAERAVSKQGHLQPTGIHGQVTKPATVKWPIDILQRRTHDTDKDALGSHPCIIDHRGLVPARPENRGFLRE